MSRDDRDKRGGHTRRKFGTYSCQCCPILRPRTQAQNRTERNRALDKYERRAEGNR
jgi:hypothetical protein